MRLASDFPVFFTLNVTQAKKSVHMSKMYSHYLKACLQENVNYIYIYIKMKKKVKPI